MSTLRFKAFTGAVVGASLLVSSTGAIAAANPAPAEPQVSPWAALAVLSGAQPAAVVCGSAAAAAAAAATATAAQPAAGCVLPATDVPPPVATASEPPAPIPVPPVEVAGAGVGLNPLLLALAAIAAAAGLYFLVRNHNNSPA